ncbi:beta-ketoacyl synthase N-terminal-like domain-containing protein [Nocardia sp. CA-107356]|uniref:beta-ketoacyl synthase N-terminal-like domain-containing protein n=1 Tax=Nocardia sp. CA-107356 TaxID=3239972 RepID=UPI003D94A59F
MSDTDNGSTAAAVAIVGIGCLLPGAHTPEQFWDQLLAGADLRSAGGAEVFGADPATRGGWGDPEHGIASARGGFVTEPDIDPTGLRVDAERIDGLGRVVRWPLYVVRQALADAGITEDDPVLARTGLVLGNYSFPTERSVDLCVPLTRRAVDQGLRAAGLPLPHNDTGAWSPAVPVESLWPSGLPTTVVGDALGLGGPRLALDAACSSALYSISLGRDYLSTGAADIVLAGAVCAPDPLLIHLSFSDLRAFPDNGISQPFRADSTGIVTGQGAGVVVLKRLADAERDGDTIYAVIESIGIGNDGAGAHLLAPNVEGQLAAYRQAYGGGIDPTAVDYIECHATGTPVGDPIELRGLTEFFGDDVPLLGSVKGNIGHLLTVAGFTSVLKATLAMRHGVIPATPAVADPIRPAGAESAAARIVTTNRQWPERDSADDPHIRRAGVSAFGFGGTNAHIVLAQAADAPAATAAESEVAAGGNAPTETGSDDVVASDTMLDTDGSGSRRQANSVQPVRMALSGMGVRVGGIAGVDAMRQVVRTGRPALVPRPEPRWYGAEQLGIAELEEQRDAGYVDSVEVDVRAYRMPPAELAQVNPQHLLFFQAAEEALAEAGLTTSGRDQAGRRVGVVVAMEMEPRSHAHRARFDIGAHVRAECARAAISLSDDELDRLETAVRAGVHDPIGANEVLSYIGNIMASRIASAHNLTGPAFTVSADATGGARALEVAGLLLLDPTVEAVLVGGVELAAGVENTLVRTALAQGRRPILGDGAAALVLTRSDGTEPLTIDSVVVHQDIGSADATDELTPGADLRARLEKGYAATGFALDEVAHLEVASAVADTDLTTLARLFPARAPEVPSCAVTSHISLAGDAQQAGVLAGIISAALCLRHRELPPAPAALRESSDAIGAFDDSALHLLDAPAPWLGLERDRRRVAAVHAVSGSSTAHIVLSAAPATDPVETTDWSGGGAPLLIPLHGDDGTALAARAADCLAALDSGRTAMELAREYIAAPRTGRYTAVLVAADAAALRRELDAATRHLPDLTATGGEWATPAGSYCTTSPVGRDARVAFVYPGAFTAYPGAGRELFSLFPGLQTEFERDATQPWAEFKHASLYPSGPRGIERSALMRHEGELIESIPTMLAIGTNAAVLNTRLLRDGLGIHPDGGFGYSLGESSMLFAMDVWDASVRDDAPLVNSPLFVDQLRGPKRLIRAAWGLPDDLPDKQVWTTQVLLAGAAQVRTAMTGLDRVFLTHINTPVEVVVAGFPEAVKELIARLGCKSAKAPANHVMHCAAVESERAAFAGLNNHPLGHPAADLELLSSFDYGLVDPTDRTVIADRIAETLCSTVDFSKLIEGAYDRGFRVFIEVGPGASCTRWVAETLSGREHVAVPVDRRGAKAGTALAQALARLVSHGVGVRLDRLFPASDAATQRSRFSIAVTCGGESVVDRVTQRTAPIIAAALRTDTSTVAMTSAADITAIAAETTILTVEPDLIIIEGEPFVYLPRRQPALQPAPYQPSADRPAPRPVDPQPQQSAPLVAALTQPALAAPASGRLETARTRVLRPMSTTVSSAHQSFLRAQSALLHRDLDALEAGRGSFPPPPHTPEPAAPHRTVVWDEDDLLEFAVGKVANVFGPEFAEIDEYPVRVRLPELPYHFVTRVTELHATTRQFEPCSITTEYDVPKGAWYSVDGLVPCAVTIEAGQCDLLLVSYLGIDFRNKGERVYRLLDSELVFHGGLPREGQTLRYEIKIDRFVWNGDSLLFFFNYRCFADGVLILELLDACAGFFSALELEDSLGVVFNAADRKRREAMTKTWFKPLARTNRTSLTAQDLQLLAEGRPADVFGPAWDQTSDGCNRSLRLPDSMLRMVDEITTIDRLGGPRALGEISAVKYLDADGWYFRCHFTGDPVLAGSLVAEGGVQLLQTYALYLGLHLVLPDAEFQSVPGLKTQVKVRGQITPKQSSIRYHVEITEITMLPRPTVIADIIVYDGDKAMISMRNFGVQVREKPGTPYRPEIGGVPAFLGRRNQAGEAAFINELHLAHAAKGDLATAMGREFEIYADRKAPYIPNGDFRFVDRIMKFNGVRGELKAGATMETEYDCPPEAWYFHENAFPGMPNCVYMESSLQAAILLGYYLGASLATPEQELNIRNLDGKATVVKQVDLRGKTIRQHTTMLFNQIMPGTSLQKFRYELFADGELFYRGESMFGYHTAEALSAQVGLDNSAYVAPWFEQQLESMAPQQIRTLAVRSEDSWFDRDGLRLADGHLRLIDEVDIVSGGGKYDQGYLRGLRHIDHDDWYFFCHFYRDPVMPGSLGVEALIQALQVYAIDIGAGAEFADPVFAMPLDVEMVWKYRGQILRTEGPMTFDLHIKEVRHLPDEGAGARVLVIADANVWKPGLRIYELANVAVEVHERREDER